jgi:hypothetical protein
MPARKKTPDMGPNKFKLRVDSDDNASWDELTDRYNKASLILQPYDRLMEKDELQYINSDSKIRALSEIHSMEKEVRDKQRGASKILSAYRGKKEREAMKLQREFDRKMKEEVNLRELASRAESLGLIIGDDELEKLRKKVTKERIDSAIHSAPLSPTSSSSSFFPFTYSPSGLVSPVVSSIGTSSTSSIIEDEYTKRRRLQQERIDKLKLDLYANANVPQMKDQYGQWIERPPEYLPENVPSRSLTRAGANMMGISRRNLRGEWDVKNLQRMKIPLRAN